MHCDFASLLYFATLQFFLHSCKLFTCFDVFVSLLSCFLPTTSDPVNHATGYASQHIWCLSQARIKWEGCGRKGIWHKNGGQCWRWVTD